MSATFVQYRHSVSISNAQTEVSDNAILNQQQYRQCTAMNYAAFTQTQQSQAITKKQLVFFDWDDTIFPTTACIRNKEVIPDAALEIFGKSAHDLLLHFINVYSAENFYVVTNGASEWISKSLNIMSALQTTGTDYWTAIKQLLATKLEGHVISARLNYEAKYPGQSTLWKTLVFQQIAIEIFGINFEGERNIVSVGDSTDEFDASMETVKMLRTQYGVNSVNLVRMQLKERPSYKTMFQEFAVIQAIVSEINRTGINCIDIQIADFV